MLYPRSGGVEEEVQGERFRGCQLESGHLDLCWGEGGAGAAAVYLLVYDTVGAFSWALHSPVLFGFQQSLSYACGYYLRSPAGIYIFLAWIRAKQPPEASRAPSVLM